MPESIYRVRRRQVIFMVTEKENELLWAATKKSGCASRSDWIRMTLLNAARIAVPTRRVREELEPEEEEETELSKLHSLLDRLP